MKLTLKTSGQVKPDHGLLRQIAGLCNLLPAIDTDAFKEDFLNVRVFYFNYLLFTHHVMILI